MLLPGILLIVPLSQELQKDRQHPVRLGNMVIDYTSPIRKLDPLAMGMDISGYGTPNVLVNDQLEQQKLKALGMKYMRIGLKYSTPGDPTSKIICSGSGCDTRWTGSQWIQTIKSLGAQPLILVPSSPVDAANMVKYFNKNTNNYVRYWVIGNEPDLANIPAATYSINFNQEYDAMKAIDPTIKIGGGVTAWYDAPFLQAFLQQSGKRVDFVDFHSYGQEGKVPGDETVLFQRATQLSNDINNLRSLIQRIVPGRASQIGIEVGEWELNWNGDAQNQTNFHAVWTASVLGHILSSGSKSLFYADKNNALYENWHVITISHERKVTIHVDDPGPAYHGIGMFTGEGLFRGFGDTLVRAYTTLPQVEVYASNTPKNIVVINKDPSMARIAVVRLKGINAGKIEIWRKDGSMPFLNPPLKLGTRPVLNGTFTCWLPPLSVTVFLLHPA